MDFSRIQKQEIYETLDYSFLLDELSLLAKQFHNQILSHIKNCKQEALRIIEVDENLVLVYEQSSATKTILQVGFPFSLIDKEIEPLTKGTIKICLKGEKIRSYQRKILQNFLSSKQVDRIEFNNIVKDICNSKKIANTICPYTFRGDVYISEFFDECFREHLGIEVKNKFSALSKDIEDGYKSYDLETLKNTISPGEIILLPDLIDVHFKKSLQVIQAFYLTNPIFFIGRNMIISDKIYYLDEPDFLLRDRNIDLYMREQLIPFIGNFKLKTPFVEELKLDRVLVNFLSSQKLRDVEFVIAKKLIELLFNEGSKIYMTVGYFKIDKDIEWINSFFEMYPEIKDKVTLLNTPNMYDLQKIVKNEKITFGFSPDTSVPHMLSHVGVPCIVMINPKQFDNTSLLSIISNSSIGFCRLTQPQIPILLKKNEEQEILEKIISLIKKIQNEHTFEENEHKKFDNLYPLDDFFQIPIQEHSLVSWKMNNPILKLKMIKNGKIY